MRYWDRPVDPDKPTTRSRSTVHGSLTPAPSQFGQRPMFSVPGEDQPPPAQTMIGTEARLDPIVPLDESESSRSQATLEFPNARAGTMLTFSTNNVSNPPTKAEIDAAFGARPSGWIGFIIDAGGSGVVWLCIRSQSSNWYFELLTKAT